MSIPLLSVVPAGAGSGKTHHIQECLADWIESGEVAPERIVAVTFTEAAAAELRERVRAIGAEVDWLASRVSSGTRFALRLPVAALLDAQSASK